MAKSQRGHSPARGNFRFVKRTSFAALPARKSAALQKPLFLLGKNGVRGIGNGERRDENRLKNIFFACRASGHSDTLARPWRVETPIFALSPPIRSPTKICPPVTPPTAHSCSFSSIPTDDPPIQFICSTSPLHCRLPEQGIRQLRLHDCSQYVLASWWNGRRHDTWGHQSERRLCCF